MIGKKENLKSSNKTQNGDKTKKKKKKQKKTKNKKYSYCTITAGREWTRKASRDAQSTACS